MAGEKGYNARDFVIKLTPIGGGAKVKVAAVRGRTITRAKEPVDTTNDDSSGWRQLLGKPGTRSLDLSIEGVATSENYYDFLQRWNGETLEDVTLEFPDGTEETGDFFLGSLAQTGTHDGDVAFTAELQSAGPVTVVAPAAPTVTMLPAILGAPQVGVASKLFLGAYTGAPAIAWKVQHDIGAGYVDIAGATGTGANDEYTPGGASEGFPLRLVVAATNAIDSVTATSAPTPDVLAA